MGRERHPTRSSKVAAHAAVVACLLLLALATDACGGGDASPGRPDVSSGPWYAGEKRYVHVWLPAAEHLRAADASNDMLGVVLKASGTFFVEGESWPVEVAASPDAFARLRRALDTACSTRDPSRDVPRGCRVPMRLRADAFCAWPRVADVLRETLRGDAGIRRLLWAVRSPSAAVVASQEAQVVERAPRAASPIQVTLSARRAPEDRVDVRLSIGTWSRTLEDVAGGIWTPGPAEPAVWPGASAALRAAAGDRDAVELHIEDGPSKVGWRHVVGVFDVVLAADLHVVDLPALDVRLVLAPPQDTSGPPFVYPDDPVATPLLIVLCALAALLAIAATFAPLVLGRSARKRPRGP